MGIGSDSAMPSPSKRLRSRLALRRPAVPGDDEITHGIGRHRGFSVCSPGTCVLTSSSPPGPGRCRRKTGLDVGAVAGGGIAFPHDHKAAAGRWRRHRALVTFGVRLTSKGSPRGFPTRPVAGRSHPSRPPGIARTRRPHHCRRSPPPRPCPWCRQRPLPARDRLAEWAGLCAGRAALSITRSSSGPRSKAGEAPEAGAVKPESAAPWRDALLCYAVGRPSHREEHDCLRRSPATRNKGGMDSTLSSCKT